MLRYRRYRVFVVFAVIVLFALYKFGGSGTSWQDGNSGSQRTNGEGQPVGDGDAAETSLHWKPRPQVAQETKKPDLEVAAASETEPRQKPPAVTPVDKPVDKLPPHAPTRPPATISAPVEVYKPVAPAEQEQLVEMGKGRVEITSIASTVPPVHWSKASEHFPLATKDLIKLPAGKSKSIPKIQFEFKAESAAEKKDREHKLDIIKGVFKQSWDGYREHAWLQDELKPLKGGYRNPFSGWGATLVDSLDSLWIMGMKKEFEEAVNATSEIDFTTSPRPDIPVFETTIRYLGGLLAAYDLSERKYEILLTKAVELAEVLMGAFDTPNRMPLLYYYWRPGFTSQPHRASTRVVLAEIGSLSVEFTRLAQITKEDKYYDAIARITDKLEAFQNKTRLPGMWPTYLDASGCKQVNYASAVEPDPQKPLAGLEESPVPDAGESPTATTEKLSPNGKKYTPLDLPSPIVFIAQTGTPSPSPSTGLVEGVAGKARIGDWKDDTTVGELTKDSESLKKRQLDDIKKVVATNVSSASSTSPASPTSTRVTCEEQEFISISPTQYEEYTLGGMSDSTYEYLPKEWLLLGGQVEKYKTMYEASVEAAKEKLLFRPMLPEGEDILFSGKLTIYGGKPTADKFKLEGENAHLTCFAGGLFGMGAKIFDRPEDLEIAKKLTEGCVWSYDMTATGIMPEAFNVIPCDSTTQCQWNETLYKETLDPNADARLESYERQMEIYKENMKSASARYEAELASATGAPLKTAINALEVEATPTPAVWLGTLEQVDAALEQSKGMKKRQLEVEFDSTSEPVPSAEAGPKPPKKAPGDNSKVRVEPEDPKDTPTRVQSNGTALPSPSWPVFPVIYSPRPAASHEEYIKSRIKDERLPKGVINIGSRNYILRPEAIESVYYMYRITGDPHWREAGWRMFEAINTHTATKYGNSAIDDVTKSAPDIKDEMESFWLAETLKYFYLLFSEENVVSLDEWVLNTEAHPFRRPT